MATFNVGFKPHVFDVWEKTWSPLEVVVPATLDLSRLEFVTEASSFGPGFNFGPHLHMDEDLVFAFVRHLRSPEDGELLASEYRQVGGRFKLTVFND